MLTTIPAKTVLEIIEGCDGHLILNPAHLVEQGLPAPLVLRVTQRFEAKPGLMPDCINLHDDVGRPIAVAFGVDDLTLLYAICRELGIDSHNRYIGRGWQARCLQERIRRHLGQDG